VFPLQSRVGGRNFDGIDETELTTRIDGEMKSATVLPTNFSAASS